MFCTVYKVTNESIQPAFICESETLTPGDGVNFKDDVMRFVMTSNRSNTLNLVVDIPRLLNFRIMVRYFIYIYATFRSLKQHTTLWLNLIALMSFMTCHNVEVTFAYRCNMICEGGVSSVDLDIFCSCITQAFLPLHHRNFETLQLYIYVDVFFIFFIQFQVIVTKNRNESLLIGC